MSERLLYRSGSTYRQEPQFQMDILMDTAQRRKNLDFTRCTSLLMHSTAIGDGIGKERLKDEKEIVHAEGTQNADKHRFHVGSHRSAVLYDVLQFSVADYKHGIPEGLCFRLVRRIGWVLRVRLPDGKPKRPVLPGTQ